MANSNDDNSYFYSLAQMVKPIRQKADSYKAKTGERYVYTPDELAIVQHANEELEKKLGKYIHDFLKKGGYSSFANQYEDLYSICLIKIFERFPEYNGQYKLTTFIARDLKLAINKYLGKEKGLSQYYNEQNVKIQKAIKEINTNGIEPTVPEISKIVNAGKNKKISEKTIRTVLDIKEHGNVCSLELCEAHAESLDSPEEEYIKGEEAQMVYDILSTLLPYERIAFKLINGVVDEETGPHAAGTFISGCTYKDDLNARLVARYLRFTTLNVITDALRMIKKNHGIAIDPYEIPFEKEVFKEIFAKGNTIGVFQFESPGMRAYLKRLKPENIEDVIILNAMYRPGPMDFIPGVCDVKNGKCLPHYETPELEPILGDTYGAIVYQEQVMEICKQLAGYSMGQADNIRRAMSKKKQYVIDAERSSFVYGDPERNIKG